MLYLCGILPFVFHFIAFKWKNNRIDSHKQSWLVTSAEMALSEVKRQI